MHFYNETWIYSYWVVRHYTNPLIVKTKTGDVTDKNNYRPMAVATSMSKVMELLTISKTECFLNTSDNQFDFKKKLGLCKL